MTTQTSQSNPAAEVIRKGIDAFNRHDVAGFVATYAADAQVHDPFYPQPLKGRAAIEKDIREFFTALPDARMTISNLLTGGNTVGVEGVLKGTNNGSLAMPDGSEVPATGRPLTMGVAIFSRVDATGLVAEEQRYFDMASLAAQLGLSQ